MANKSFVRELIHSRMLPKSGQITSYAAGDDGEYESGWWKGRFNADNLNRFISDTLSGDDVVIDLATGLLWARLHTAAGCNNDNVLSWVDAIAYALALDFAGFTDWRLPNAKELLSLINYHTATVPNPFTDSTQEYWTATTDPALSTRAYHIHTALGDLRRALKTGLKQIRCVRTIL